MLGPDLGPAIITFTSSLAATAAPEKCCCQNPPLAPSPANTLSAATVALTLEERSSSEEPDMPGTGPPKRNDFTGTVNTGNLNPRMARAGSYGISTRWLPATARFQRHDWVSRVWVYVYADVRSATYGIPHATLNFSISRIQIFVFPCFGVLSEGAEFLASCA